MFPTAPGSGSSVAWGSAQGGGPGVRSSACHSIPLTGPGNPPLDSCEGPAQGWVAAAGDVRPPPDAAPPCPRGHPRDSKPGMFRRTFSSAGQPVAGCGAACALSLAPARTRPHSFIHSRGVPTPLALWHERRIAAPRESCSTRFRVFAREIRRTLLPCTNFSLRGTLPVTKMPSSKWFSRRGIQPLIVVPAGPVALPGKSARPHGTPRTAPAPLFWARLRGPGPALRSPRAWPGARLAWQPPHGPGMEVSLPPPHLESMPLPGSLCLVSTMSALLPGPPSPAGSRGIVRWGPAPAASCLPNWRTGKRRNSGHSPLPHPKTSSDVSREHLHRPVRSPPAPCGP